MQPTQEQSKAISTFDKNVLLLAPAGTGKTFTVAHKVAEAIRLGIPPQSVLCLSFTVKAQDEIKADVLKYCGQTAVNSFTFHGFFYRLIKEYYADDGQRTPFAVADEIDVGETAKNIADSMIETTDDEKSILPEKKFAAIISSIKRKRDSLGFRWSSRDGYGVAFEELKKDEAFLELFQTRRNGVWVTDYKFFDLLSARAKAFMLKYSDALASSNLLDFDDLVYAAKEIIFQGKTPLDRYKVIILDEVQDTDYTEYEIISKFFPYAHVTLVGDENQTIYGWRGSAPERIIADFRERFSPEEIRLTVNRRSTDLLRRAARGYLANGFGKGFDEPATTLSGEKITLLKCEDEYDEAEKIFSTIADYEGDNTDICIMARSNAYVSFLHKRLNAINRRLPQDERLRFFIADSDHKLYKKPIIKDFLAFLRLTINPSDVAALERICKRRLKTTKSGLVSAISDYGSAGVSLADFLNPDAYEFGDPFAKLIAAYERGLVVCYDLETTGADPYRDDPIQISAIKFGKNSATEEFNLFVIPSCEISAGAIATHGYDLDYIETHGAVCPEKAIADFAAFSKDCVLVGHNSSQFDDIILSRIAKKHSIELSPIGFFDTLAMAKTLFKGEKNYKLSTLCEKFGVVNERAHDAFADVQATAECLTVMLDDYLVPSVSPRRAIISSNSSAFNGLCADIARFKTKLSNGELRSAITDIASTYNLITPDSKKEDRESANDLYLALKSVETAEEPLEELRELLSNVALSSSQLDALIKKLKKIPLITIHQSKGCEFDEVILVGASEAEIPSSRAKTKASLEEEKRVFYVAMTRAKRKLVVSYQSTQTYGNVTYERKPSPYTDYIPSDCIERK